MASKPKFKLIITQRGEGCDYTIGCGTVVEDMKANDEAAALVEAQKSLDDYGMLPGDWERELDTAILVKEWVELPYKDWQDLARDRLNEKAEKKEEQKARKEYEALKKRFDR